MLAWSLLHDTPYLLSLASHSVRCPILRTKARKASKPGGSKLWFFYGFILLFIHYYWRFAKSDVLLSFFSYEVQGLDQKLLCFVEDISMGDHRVIFSMKWLDPVSSKLLKGEFWICLCNRLEGILMPPKPAVTRQFSVLLLFQCQKQWWWCACCKNG